MPRRIDNMKSFNHWVLRTDLVSTNLLQILGWQPRPQSFFWYTQPCHSLLVETKSVRSLGSNNGSILPRHLLGSKMQWDSTSQCSPWNSQLGAKSSSAITLMEQQKKQLIQSSFFYTERAFCDRRRKGWHPVPEWLFARPDTADSEIGSNAGPIEESLGGGGYTQVSMIRRHWAGGSRSVKLMTRNKKPYSNWTQFTGCWCYSVKKKNYHKLNDGQKTSHWSNDEARARGKWHPKKKEYQRIVVLSAGTKGHTRSRQ